MRAVILAGGEGKGLRPLTCTCSASAAPLFGKALADYTVKKIFELKPTALYALLGYKASKTEGVFEEKNADGIKIVCVTEENSFNTAGSLKMLLPPPDGETTLVIYGNVFFDFDLKQIYEFHKAENNLLTYAEGFSGVYFLESKVFDYIPENTEFDLEKELLPILRESEHGVGSFKAEGYRKNIKTVNDYLQIHFDCLKNKRILNLPELADGFFCEGSVPTGEYIAVPPVWIGENVQIEKGAVIGPFAAIGAGSLISKGAKIRDSVLLDNVYISSKCNVNGALICEGASVKHFAKIFEGAVVGADSIVGESAVIAGGVRIWPGKYIADTQSVIEDVKYAATSSGSLKINSFIAGDFGIELTPEKAAKLGAALGTLFENVRVGVGIDGEANSLALKCGFLGGLISTGAKSFDFGKCFCSQMFYYSVFCDLDFAVFISGGTGGASFSFYEKGGIPLIYEHINKLEEIMQVGGFNRCSGGDCRSVTVMDSAEKMYFAEVMRMFSGEKISFGASALSGNRIIFDCVNECLKKLSCNTECEDLIFKINKTGTMLTAVENSQSFSHEKILAAVSYNEMLAGNDIVLSWEAPQIITSLGGAMGRRVYRFSDNTHFSDIGVFNNGIKQLWSRDAVFLLFKLLSYMNEKNATLKQLAEELPEFYIAKKVTEIDVEPQKIEERLLNNDFEKTDFGGVIFKKSSNNLKIKHDSDGKALKIIAEAFSYEAANELCDEVFELLNTVNAPIDKEG